MENEYFNPIVRIQVCAGHRVPLWRYDNLSTPHWRLYFNRGGDTWVNLHGKKTALDPLHWILIPPNTPFSCFNNHPFEHLYIHFTAKPPFERVSPEVFSFSTDAKTRSRLTELYNLSLESPFPSGRREILALSLVCQALGQIPEDRLDKTRMDPRVLDSIHKTEQDFSSPAGNAALARRAGMNENAFIRLFRQQTGSSPQAYLTVKRIEAACDMLHRSTAPIHEIAAATGFCDRYHFSRVFKKIRGVSPALFRNQAYFASGK